MGGFWLWEPWKREGSFPAATHLSSKQGIVYPTKASRAASGVADSSATSLLVGQAMSWSFSRHHKKKKKEKAAFQLQTPLKKIDKKREDFFLKQCVGLLIDGLSRECS